MAWTRRLCLYGALLAATALSAATQSPEAPAPDTAGPTMSVVRGNFLQGFIASISVVVVSELGDKTFFIAAIMAMKHPRVLVFCGAISALVFMTVLSALFGSIATVIPRVYTHYISAALFAIFGVKMLRDGLKMKSNEGQEELESVQRDLKTREDEGGKSESDGSKGSDAPSGADSPASGPPSPEAEQASPAVDTAAALNQAGAPELSTAVDKAGPSKPRPAVDPAAGLNQAGPSSQKPADTEEKEETLDMLEAGQAESRRRRRRDVVKVLLQAATLTFLAEWGDRSQLATVVLATREDVLGVIVGGSLGHALCTGLAVVGGRMVAQRISVKTVTIIGGVVFLIFAVSALIIGPG